MAVPCLKMHMIEIQSHLPTETSVPSSTESRTMVIISDSELNMEGYVGPRRVTAHEIKQKLMPVLNTP